MTTSERNRLESELASLPPGSIVRRMIRGAERFYHQWRENGKTRSRYLAAHEVPKLRALIERRRELARLLSGRTVPGVHEVVSAFRTDITTGRALLDLAHGVENFKTRDMFPSILNCFP